MRSRALAAACACVALGGVALAAPRPGGAPAIRWVEDYPKAEELARKLGRPILMFWHDESCSLLPSTRAELLASPEVRARATLFVSVEVDFEKDASVVEKFEIVKNIHGDLHVETPVKQGFIFAEAGGRIHGRLPGKPRFGALPRMMDGVVKAFGPIATNAQLRSLERGLESAKKLKKSGPSDRAVRALQKMVETGFRCEPVLEARALLGRMGAAGRKALAAAEEVAKAARRKETARPVRRAQARRQTGASSQYPPHTQTWRECDKCKEALEKAMAFVKEKTGQIQWYDGWLGTFFCGFAFMMDGRSEKELDWCITNTRRYMMEVSACEGMRGYRNWFVSMSMLVVAEYSLRYGLTPENKAALEWAHQYAIENVDDTGGWFHHPRHGGKNYAADISMIGCMYYSAFLEMEALGLGAEPGLTLASAYVRSISDGRTIGYGTPWKNGGGGSGGKDGLVLMGFYASGNEDDPFAQSLGEWLTEHPESPPRGHASNFHHFFGQAVGLHRMGPEHYAKFAGHWLHRLIDCQKPDGSIGRLPHDCPPEKLEEALKELGASDKHDWITAGILAGLIMMTEPGTFAGLPAKKPGSMSNRKAFDTATAAMAEGDYAKAYRHFAEVLPPGDSGELIPKARIKLREIESLARERLDALAKKEDEVTQRHAGNEYTLETVRAYDGMIAAYEGYAKSFAGMALVKAAAARREALKRKVFGLRLRVVSGAGSGRRSAGGRPGKAGGPDEPATPAKLKDPGAVEVWTRRLKARVEAVVKSGRRLSCTIRAFGGRVTVVAVDSEGLKARLPSGAQLGMKWARLQRRDLRDLAVRLAATQATPADHALAAFFLLCDGETDEADAHLREAKEKGADVRAAFGLD
ncbi:MAG: DUF6288 domain-containing protein [Planctomycetota bacterium]|jgi:hypothetical protein